MTEFELLALMRETSYTISQDFEFFMTVTFGVIVATYAVGERLKLFPRIVITILYVCATYLFFARYLNFISQLQFISTSLVEMGSNFPLPETKLPGLTRRIIYLAGSMAAVCTIFWPIITGEVKIDVDE